MIAMLRCYAHPSVRPASAPSPAPAGPPCLARDWLSGASCSLAAGHGGQDHASEDQDFEIRWRKDGPADVRSLIAEVERLRRGMALILEFCDPPDDENDYCGCQEIAEEALGHVVGGPWFGPEAVER